MAKTAQSGDCDNTSIVLAALSDYSEQFKSPGALVSSVFWPKFFGFESFSAKIFYKFLTREV